MNDQLLQHSSDQTNTSLSVAQTHFAARLIECQLVTQVNQNFVYSPFSIFVALLMTNMGASGETLKELSKALCLSPTWSLNSSN